jgi:prenyl protein peptidase
MLSHTSAWLLSSFFAISYVSSVYIFPAGRLVFTARQVEVGPQAERARLVNERWRNDPAVIKARVSGVVTSTIGSCLTVFTVVTMMGSWPVSLF